ncbi:GlmU [Desulfamplus magnetovallimortis]|uniref:GlmU n=1 Tax=Desulfamplus magnetovallimortis TaxID=1246637 RepID=A0A1W1HC90_9BACT|nr:protein GlmU [Desulfamplus magnetovallimortis]SLM30100.1 GlmU [Desulfamplus magnetovallimortis]
MALDEKIKVLLEKGVNMPLPQSVFIGDEIDLSRISGEGVSFYPGTRITGKKTLIMEGASIGFEAPVTLDDVFVGPGTRLGGGFFQKCLFAGSNTFGSGAHVRGGTILEEEACAAHTVGLKQTILFPFVTLGSLINFCDCLMAGGTSRKDHSEVGSSFIHFNYTPNQDKATPSIFGNVYQGVMLNCKPVFLGGQGGVVGPCRLPFGTVTAAGTIWRKDVAEEGRLLFGGAMKEGSIRRTTGIYTDIKRIFMNNCRYIAALISLLYWYRNVRALFVSSLHEKYLFKGMKDTLEIAIDERIKRLGDFVDRLKKSRHLQSGKALEPIIEQWQSVHELFINKKDPTIPFDPITHFNDASIPLNDSAILFNEDSDKLFSRFIPYVEKNIRLYGSSYVKVIKNLEPSASLAGSNWLESMENTIIRQISDLMKF